jgi:phosphoketolase
MPDILSGKELNAMDAYWRAANYLSVGQIVGGLFTLNAWERQPFGQGPNVV